MNCSMYLKLSFCIVLIFGFASCSRPVLHHRKIKTETESESEYFYKYNKRHKISKWRTGHDKTGYVCYDQKGSITKKCDYGEYRCITTYKKNSDSSTTISTGCYRIRKNINTVNYYTYDSGNKKTTAELWKFKDNKKNYLIGRTIFEYNANGTLIKETEFDEDSNITRLQDYSKDKTGKLTSKDSVFKFSYEGIVRVDGKSQDTTIEDSLGRPVEKIHFFKDKFLYRQAYLYEKGSKNTTELRYDNKPDSLWCITEWQYNIKDQLVRKFWKVIGSTIETRDVYIYNKRNLLTKILHYDDEGITSYTKYRHKYFRY